MAENLLHLVQVTSGIHQKAGEAVAQVMDADICPRPPLGAPSEPHQNTLFDGGGLQPWAERKGKPKSA
jgi:hypothetical protein